MEWTVVSVIVVLVGLISTVVAGVNSSNKRWTEFNTNLVENTITLKKIQEYLNKLENETTKRFEKHEQRMNRHEERLDDHHEKIIQIVNKINNEN